MIPAQISLCESYSFPLHRIGELETPPRAPSGHHKSSNLLDNSPTSPVSSRKMKISPFSDLAGLQPNRKVQIKVEAMSATQFIEFMYAVLVLWSEIVRIGETRAPTLRVSNSSYPHQLHQVYRLLRVSSLLNSHLCQTTIVVTIISLLTIKNFCHLLAPTWRTSTMIIRYQP